MGVVVVKSSPLIELSRPVSVANEVQFFPVLIVCHMQTGLWVCSIPPVFFIN